MSAEVEEGVLAGAPEEEAGTLNGYLEADGKATETVFQI